MEIEPPAEYGDVNEAVVDEWTDDTTARERIRSVIQRTREPTPASAIAERARASEPAVRDTLAGLVDIGLVETQKTGQGTLYKRNDRMYIYRQVVALQNQYDEDELVAQLQSLKDTVNSLREQYSVETPTELAQELDPDDTEGWDDHTTWQTAQKNLYLAKAALSFYDAQRVVV
jgi:predicted transcriptional regulator